MGDYRVQVKHGVAATRRRRDLRSAGRHDRGRRPPTPRRHSASSTCSGAGGKASPRCWPTRWTTPSWWATPSWLRNGRRGGWRSSCTRTIGEGSSISASPCSGRRSRRSTGRGAAGSATGRPSPPPQQDANAAALGFTNDRDLLQIRVELPLAPGTRRDVPPLDVRPFRPGADEAVWLEVNNRAFADHPEQGGWDLEALQAARGRAVVRPGRLPAARGGRTTGRVVLDQGAPGRRPGPGRDLRHLGGPRLPPPGPRPGPDRGRAGLAGRRRA